VSFTAGQKVAKYIRILQETKTLGFTVKPRTSLIRLKILEENLQKFQDHDIDIPEDGQALKAGLRELIQDGLLQGEDELRYVSVTAAGAKKLIIAKESEGK
jgi:hypothetical protein